MPKLQVQSVAIIGLGAFGALIAEHLRPHFRLLGYDAHADQGPAPAGVALTDLANAARADIIVLAVPVDQIEAVVEALGPHLRPGAVVIDVASVKLRPADILQRCAPADVGIVGAHPLFGPQSARQGVRGLKIALCPLRGASAWRIGAFLRARLGLKVLMTTPDAHDREAAIVQGLTHFIAKILVRMEPLPTRFTTRSYDMLQCAVDMVRNDAPAVFDAIELANPYTAEIRARFLRGAEALDGELRARTPLVVAFQGERGAFGERAIRGRWPAAQPLPVRSFEDVLAALIARRCDLAVLPVWNTTIGAIDAARAAIGCYRHAVRESEEITVPVRHALLAKPGATLETLRWVASHDAALRQCAKFLADHPHWSAVEAYDTAGAARELGRGGPSGWFAELAARPEQLAVIASAAAADAYGLCVLLDGIQDDAENATRFVVLERKGTP